MLSIRKLAKYGALHSKIAGYLMALLGIMLIINTMTTLIEWLTRLDGGFTDF